MNFFLPFLRMVSDSGELDFPSLEHQGCICRSWDVAITSLIPSDMGHVLQLGETQKIITPLSP